MFSESDRQRIQAAVRAAEERTAGEIAVVYTRRAGDYAFRRASLSFGLSVAASSEALLLFPEVPPVLILLGQLPVALLAYLAFGWAPLLRLIAGRAVREACVRERALRSFVEDGVTETRDRSGVLIFLSEAEHQVIILADKGINDRVAPTEWQQDVASLVSAIAAGRAAEGVVAVVERIGGLLAEAFPRRDDDENELSDAVQQVR